jgi:hypothetical protein
MPVTMYSNQMYFSCCRVLIPAIVVFTIENDRYYFVQIWPHKLRPAGEITRIHCQNQYGPGHVARARLARIESTEILDQTFPIPSTITATKYNGNIWPIEKVMQTSYRAPIQLLLTQTNKLFVYVRG